jgi:hypothetical protein
MPDAPNRRFEAGEHFIQSQRETLQLIACIGNFQTIGQILDSDTPSGVAAVVLRFTWPNAGVEVARPAAPQSGCAGLAWSAFVGALVTEGIGFAAGFFGPIILDPSSPQGPLLGLFVTGPLGIVAGAIAGAVVFWVKRNARAR